MDRIAECHQTLPALAAHDLSRVPDEQGITMCISSRLEQIP